MTAIEITEAIRAKAEAELPALLTSTSLPQIDKYLKSSPTETDDKEFCVYIDYEKNDTDTNTIGIVIQVQLYDTFQDQEYHSVIFEYLKKNITESFVGYQIRENIEADIYPMDDRSTAFLYYLIEFMDMLDDCYDDDD